MNGLPWCYLKNPDANVNSYIAIPYNPYAPKEYKRWTMKGMLDYENDLMVGDRFWNFLGGENTYLDILGCFERVGDELKNEIESHLGNLY